MFIEIQSCNLWLVNMISIVFPNVDMTSFIFLKEKKLQKVDFFMILCEAND